MSNDQGLKKTPKCGASNNTASIFGQQNLKWTLEDDGLNEQSVCMEKLSLECKNAEQISPRKSASESSCGLSTPKSEYSPISDIKHYPLTPELNKVKFRIPDTASAPINYRYNRRLSFTRSSPQRPQSFSSPFCSPSSKEIKARYSKKLQSPSKSHSVVLFPKKISKKSETHFYSDRHIPSRTASILGDGALFDDFEDKTKNGNSSEIINDTYSMLLQKTMLSDLKLNPTDPPRTSDSARQNNSSNRQSIASRTRTFRYRSPKYPALSNSLSSFSPVGVDNQRLFCSSRRTSREIPKSPFKVLDAPSLKADFYLNLVDWSSENVLAASLKSCVYLWCASTSQVTKLCDLVCDSVTSVTWNPQGTQLAVATHRGDVQIWDTIRCKQINTMKGHLGRVGILAWNNHLLASGSRERMIYLRDPRSSRDWETKLQQGHTQEVCGLKWSFDGQQLASGGNDNKLLVWNSRRSNMPVIRCDDHTAAVKAIAWSPHQNSLLSSGGGTYDRCIRFRNTVTNTVLNTVDTGSQVCNLMWSKNVNEIVSTHGYSLRGKTHNNQIIVWKYPSMTRLATLTGHSCRVLYLSLSPDGQTIVTGAGDETLRFWNVFPRTKSKSGSLFFSFVVEYSVNRGKI